MPPGIVLEILVDDKGTPIIRQFDASVGKLDKTVESTGEASQKAAVGTTAFSQSLAGGTKAALGFTAGLLGIQSGIAIVQGIGRAFTGFEDSLANVNTLIPRQTALQAALRQEILRLPPALGDAKTLADGLYQALSAGVKPAQAVEFVGTAAKLARGGLADMDTTITALTKTMAVYGFDASEASRISDVFFQVVNVGQGTLKQFAGAFPDILVAGKALGVSFEDNAAALATLSAAFRSPEQAATGLVSLFSQLTMNADEFLRRGINIREVIAEKGLAGAIDALRKVTGGTSTELQKFVGDIQGQQAALTLMNSQYDTYIANTVKVRAQTGPTSLAFQEQTRTLTSAVKELGNETAKVFQGQLGEIVGEKLANVFALGAKGVRLFNTAILDTSKAADESAKALNAEATAATAGFTTTLAARTRFHQEFLAQIEREKKAELSRADEVAAAFKGLGTQSIDALEDLADGAVRNFQTILEKGRETPTRIAELWEEAKKKILAAYGALPPALEELDRQIRLNASVTTEGVAESFKRLGLRSAESLQVLARESLLHFQNILDNGDLKGQALLDTFLDITKQINTAGFATLPPEFQSVANQMQETARKLGVELPKPILDGFQQIQFESKKTATDVDLDFHTMSRAALEMSQEVRGSMASAEQSVSKFGTAVAQTSEKTQKLLDLQIRVETPFAKDLAGLTKQLDEVQKHMALVANGFFGFDLAGREFILNEDRKIIAELQKRIALLLAATSTPPGSVAPTTPGAGPTSTTPTSGGSSRPGNIGGGTSPSTPGSQRPLLPELGTTRDDPTSLLRPPDALITGGTGNGATAIPPSIQQHVARLIQAYLRAGQQGDRNAQRQWEGEINRQAQAYGYLFDGVGLRYVGNRGLRQSILEPPTRTTTPQQPPLVGAPQQGASGGGGSGGLLSGPSLPNVGSPGGGGGGNDLDALIGATRGGTININISAAAITRQGAQELAGHLAPALRELQRRGLLRAA